MERMHVILLLLAGLSLLVFAVFLRSRFGEKYELKVIDLVLIVLPLPFVLLVSGKLTVFEELLVACLRHHGSRFPIVFYEIPEEERDETAPVRLGATIDISQLKT